MEKWRIAGWLGVAYVIANVVVRTYDAGGTQALPGYELQIADTQGLCLRSEPTNAHLAAIATAAPTLCKNVDELNSADIGLLLLSAGVKLDQPSCQAELARLILKFKALHAADPERWCDNAKAVLVGHVITKPMVHADTERCGELENAAAMVAAAERLCGFHATVAGKAIGRIEMSRPCIEARMSTYQRRVEAYGGSKTKQRVWCDSLLLEHHEQVDNLGMARWFDRN